MTGFPRVLSLAAGAVLSGVLAIPASAQTSLSGDALAIACGPRASYGAPAAGISIAGSLTNAKGVYAPWHRLVVNAGSESGLREGQEFFVRRALPPRDLPPRGEKPVYAVVTAGWIRIDHLESQRAIASVIHECDGIIPGDYLEPFAAPTVPTALPPGSADYSEPGEVLFGSEGAQVAGTGSLIVINRGSDKGIRPGQRFTIFRPSEAGPNVIVGRAVALSVQADSTMARVEEMRDAVMAGDGAAPHR